jgi:hypothetical protein
MKLGYGLAMTFHVYIMTQYGACLGHILKSINIREEQESVAHLKTEQRDRWQMKVQFSDSKKSLNDVKFAPRHLGLKVAAASDGTVRIYEVIKLRKPIIIIPKALHHFPLGSRIWQDFFPGSLAGFWVRIRYFFQKKSCPSGVRNPGRKKFLPGFFGHPSRNFLLGCREKRSCQIVKERPYVMLSVQLCNLRCRRISILLRDADDDSSTR